MDAFLQVDWALYTNLCHFPPIVVVHLIDFLCNHVPYASTVEFVPF